MHYVYMVLCQDHTLYTGYTNNIGRRMAAHNSGKGAKYTRTRRPVRLVYWRAFSSREAAMSAEWHLKQKSRADKCLLCQSCQLLPALFFEEPILARKKPASNDAA